MTSTERLAPPPSTIFYLYVPLRFSAPSTQLILN